ncbi:hypothetical protein TWF696_007485 [Orbilia brochopaga]
MATFNPGLSKDVIDWARSPSILSRLSHQNGKSREDAAVSALELFRKTYDKQSPGIVQSLFSTPRLVSEQNIQIETPDEIELEKARTCGNFHDVEVSDTFLKIFYNVLKTVVEDPTANLTSPSLIGSTGTSALTIISTVPDIADHYYDLIVSANYDILISSNFWRNSYASKRIGAGLEELSRRIQRDERPPVVVKIIFDRGSAKHVVFPRVQVTPSEWVDLGLPSKKDIPNIDLEVVNYHNFPLGTLHSKYLVVDRHIGVLNSCNIQDNSNLEMMCHLEGHIVESIYEHAILTWGDKLEPSLPSLRNPIGITPAPRIPSDDIGQTSETPNQLGGPTETKQTIDTISSILERVVPIRERVAPDAPDDLAGRPFQPRREHRFKSFPIALANRAPYPAPGNVSLHTPQNIAWISAISFAQSSIFIQTPDLNATPVVSALIDAVKRGTKVTIVLCLGYNDLGEMLPLQGGHNENVVARMKKDLSAKERALLKIYWYVARDMRKPIHATKHARTCHIKLMIVDERVGIQGSGNLDTQSFFHSQETNCIIDSEEVCKAWVEQITSNQNSFEYGLGDENDGIWRDENGNTAEGSLGPTNN